MKTPAPILGLVCALCLFCGHLRADDINGAFGKKLGDTFDLAYATGRSALTDGTPMYQFTPDKPFRSFRNYYVLITPSSHKIYAIWGIGPAGNTETGKKEQALVMQILTEKYGSEDEPGIADAFGDAKHITKGSRTVYTKITGFTDTTIEIRYIDADLTALAERERLASEAKKVDSSGL